MKQKVDTETQKSQKKNHKRVAQINLFPQITRTQNGLHMPFDFYTNTSVLAGQCGNPQPQTATAASPSQPGLTFPTAAEQIISPQGPFRSLTGCSTYDPGEEHGLQIFEEL